ncbi:MAG: NUDIX hydrolase, partial [Micromonosporaceae bacterium]
MAHETRNPALASAGPAASGAGTTASGEGTTASGERRRHGGESPAASRQVPGREAALAGHEVLAVVLQVRQGELCALLWQRGRPPAQGRWVLPGGRLGADEDLGPSIRRQLAAKVDLRELSHLEQLDTRGEVRRVEGQRVIATTYLGLAPAHVDPKVPPDTAWQPVRQLPPMAFDHAAIVAAGRRRLRSKLSYTNLGFALAPPEFVISQLRDYYAAALGHDVSATNLQRVLLRRG